MHREAVRLFNHTRKSSIEKIEAKLKEVKEHYLKVMARLDKENY